MDKAIAERHRKLDERDAKIESARKRHVEYVRKLGERHGAELARAVLSGDVSARRSWISLISGEAADIINHEKYARVIDYLESLFDEYDSEMGNSLF